jgi:hypothetical protein
MFRVTGEVVRYERKPWDIDGRHGISRQARVLVGRADFVDVKYPENLPEPREGDQVDLAVTVAARQRGGVDVKVVGDFFQVVGIVDVPKTAAPAVKAAS